MSSEEIKPLLQSNEENGAVVTYIACVPFVASGFMQRIACFQKELHLYIFFTGTAARRPGANAPDNKSDDETKSAEDTEVYCCDPRRWPSALVVLGLICLLSFGSYYCYDNPVALQNIIINVMKVDFTRYNLLYSLYSWPNVILALVGGVLMDRVFGVRLGTVIFSSFICLGQVSHSNIDFTSGV